MKTFAVCHSACLDGMAGAWVVKKWDPTIEIIFCSRKYEWKNKVNFESGDFIFFIDITPNPQDLVYIFNNGAGFRVLDHHQSDYDKVLKYEKENDIELMHFCDYDMTTAGCIVAWRYFFKGENYPSLLKYIAIGDTWTWRDERDKEINQYIRAKVDTDASIEDFDEFLNYFNEESAAEEGKILYTRIKKDSKYISKKSCIMDFDGTEVLTANGYLYSSEIGHELALKSPSKIGIVYNIVPENNTVHFSVRGEKCNEFAEKYGGGGHVGAAGFYMTIDNFYKYLKTARKNTII